MKAMYPITITATLNECKEFYVDTFGFSVVFEADWYIQLLHKPSGVELAFMKPDLDNQPAQLHAEFDGKGIVYSFEVDDAKSEYERVQKTSAEIYHPLTTEEWGQTHFMVTDPAGVTVDIVEQAK